MSLNKTSLQQAIIEAKEIEKAAYENAKKIMEETISPKIDLAVKESLKEFEGEAVKAEEKQKVEEGIKLEVEPGAELTINVAADGGATVSTGTDLSSGNDAIETPEVNIEQPEANSKETDTEMENTSDDELFEVEGLSETEAPAPVDATTELPAEIPADAPVEAPVADSNNPFEVLNQKLDTILNTIETNSTEDKGANAEGEIEIVDDEVPAEQPAPEATSPAPAPADTVKEDSMGEIADMEEEVVYEIEDENNEMDEMKKMFDEMDAMEEIEIVDEDGAMEEINMNDEGLEEMGGINFSTERRAGRREKYLSPELKGHHAPRNPMSQNALSENKIKAQYESTVDELKKENESLKETVKEYKESFIVLRKQINEVQTFNAKLAYANKLFTNGGLSNEEKIRIAEEFDKIATIEEAKKLYNKLLMEFNGSKTGKNASVEKLKSVKPAVITSSTSEALYESDEVKRMKRLAGLLKENE